MAETTPFCIVLTSAGSDAQAQTLAEALVERRLAACVNVIHAVCSYFRWEGQMTREDEALLVIKTTRAAVDDVYRTIRELHSYEVPEFLVLPIEGGDRSYLGWLAANVGGG